MFTGRMAQAVFGQFYTPSQDTNGSWAFKADPALPNVLLIGDSISIGYTRDVRRMLRGRANVYRPMEPGKAVPVNCGNTKRGLTGLKSWLEGQRWRVIHFNWGLHDLCYRNPESKLLGHRDKVHGVQDLPLPQYQVNLEKLVAEMEKTRAQLIWASTTVIPPGEAGRFVGDEVKYNAVAAAIMREHHIPIDDLYALTSTFPPAMFRQPDDVHYTKTGFERIAEQVVHSIEPHLRQV